MAITVYEACKKRKRNPKILIIHNSATRSIPFMDLSGAFRDNIRLFLLNCGEKEDYTVDGSPVWCTLLASEANGVVFPLYTIEEDVRSSPKPLCDCCRCVGWGHHYVSKRRYHLIIPTGDKWGKPLTKESLTLTSHLLHGMVHCNGFGHLLTINGVVSDSNCLSGDEIMDLWDRLCTTLRTRKISLDDVSRKRSMELRLLHGVAYGRPWFGKWGYRFSHGSFGVAEDKYRRAIQILSSLELDKVMEDFSETKQGRVIQLIISSYREASENLLVTISDLLQFMLAFKCKAPIERRTAMALVAISLDSSLKTNFGGQHGDVSSGSFSEESDSENVSGGTSADNGSLTQLTTDTKHSKCSSFTSFALSLGSRWSARRLEAVAKVVCNVLEARDCSISRQELRDAVRLHIGDTGLIDFLLKHVDKVQIGNKVVHRCINPDTRMLEFSLRISPETAEPKKRRKPLRTNDLISITPGLDVYEDIFYLYENLLLDCPDFDLLSQASEIVLNCKSFVKGWNLSSQNKSLKVHCRVQPSYEELVSELTRPSPPGELLVLPENATARELKSAAEKALRDTYCIMETFEVLEIRNSNLAMITDTQVLKWEENSEFEVLVRGFGLDLGTELRYEGGFDDWTVDCKCGAKDDDGERMVACDSCKVWQHTLCNSIEDDEDVPSVFLCRKCFDAGNLRNKKRSSAFR